MPDPKRKFVPEDNESIASMVTRFSGIINDEMKKEEREEERRHQEYLRKLQSETKESESEIDRLMKQIEDADNSSSDDEEKEKTNDPVTTMSRR